MPIDKLCNGPCYGIVMLKSFEKPITLRWTVNPLASALYTVQIGCYAHCCVSHAMESVRLGKSTCIDRIQMSAADKQVRQAPEGFIKGASLSLPSEHY